ncbi:amino acid adenylation domain-containing protein [Streptomyces sp. NPDC005805]|uniref:amino acid adenylation domain-containing protein n=1 Tax=Streptomyces sp. NPDC005805 TaxID=3157068 RepID=UPI0033C2A9B7
MVENPQHALTHGAFRPDRPADDGESTAAEAATVHGGVEDWAVRTPDAVAVSDAVRSLTYAELSAEADRVARFLAAEGVRPGQRVGVRLPRGADAVVAFLAVLKAGCAYVPLDPHYPEPRLAFMTADAGLAVTVTPYLLREWGHRDVPAADGGRERRSRETAGRDIAYVIYTSGSTGEPKGVEVPHRGVVAMVAASAGHLGVDTASRFLHVSSVSFDAAVLEIWVTLLNGGHLVVADDGPPSAAELSGALGRVTHAFLPTALFHRQAEAAPESFRGLAVLGVGGEAMDAGHAATVLATAPETRLVNLYGPTEITVYCTFHVLDASRDVSAPVPIGVATRHTRLRVLDAGLREVPPGEVGELFVGGPALARGYLNRPELTAERFVPDPGDADRRLYRTGDLVRLRSDGTLEFRGRADRQMKLNGHRIEPGEVEALLRQHPGVAQAAAVRCDDGSGRPFLAAYVVLREGVPDSPARLREHLAGELPAHLVPATLDVLTEMPLTANGKLDAAALPPPVRRRDPGAGPITEPRTTLEKDLAALWQEVLGVPELSVEDEFAALGGTSLAAMRVTSAVSRRFGVSPPLAILLAGGTVATLAEWVRRTGDEGGSARYEPVPRAPEDGPVRATDGQQGLWFHDQARPGSAVYSEILPLRLRGPLKKGVLRQCVEGLVARHEALRTALVPEGRDLFLRVVGPESAVMAEIDLSGLPEAAHPRAVDEAVRWAARPFDLRRGPHLRAHLIRFSAEDHLLVLSAHHAAVDGWSANILFEELAELYRALSAGDRPALKPPARQFADFAAWQNRRVEQGAFSDDEEYWRRQLADAPARSTLPADLTAAADAIGEGALARIELPGDLVARVDRLARETGATRYMVLLAAFQLLLARHSGTDDVVVGTPASGRTHPDLDGVVGYLINTLPLRTRLNPEERFCDLLARVRATVLDGYAHQGLPFRRILRAGGVPADSLTPLVQVALVPEDVYTHAFRLADDVRAEFEYHDAGIAKYDLTLALAPRPGGGLGVNAEFRTDLFLPVTVARLLERLRTVLESATSAPDTPVGELRTLPDGELALLPRRTRREEAR